MATYNKFQDYVEQVNRGVHLWHSQTFRSALTNTAPVATQTSFDSGTNHPPPAAANGYTAGGPTLDGVTLSETTGTAKLVVTDEVITATAGGIGPFRYVVIYNDTASSPADALVCWFDYGSSISLLDTETFTIDFDPTNGLWQMVQPMTMQAAIEEIEVKMAALKADIDAKNTALAPIRAELDALNAEEQALRARIAAKVAELNAARGDGVAWIELKRKFGVLASTRMQLRAALKAASCADVSHKTPDRVCETSTTSGTGNLTLAGAVAGFQTFAGAGFANNDTCFYAIEAVDSGGVPTGDWECGVGTYVSATPALARTTVTASSNAGALVSFAGTTKRVYVTRSAHWQDPPVPTVVSVGSSFTSTGVPTATLPGTHAADDILLLLIQQANQVDYAAPAGYTRLGPQNGIGAAGIAGSTKLCMFWKRDNGAESAPTLTDSGDHTFGVMLAIRGHDTVENPQVLNQGFKFVASTAGATGAGWAGGGAPTKVGNCLYLGCFAHAIDSASAQASSPTATTLTNLTEQFDGSTADGVGGGLAVISGELSVNHLGIPFTIGLTWAGSTVDVSQMIAFLPNTHGKRSAAFPRSSETQVFIGSPADLDDNWRKPSWARKVLVQKIGGAQSGSGGNTTTTAAGGGAGGGGGYDEAWYDANELSANVTVHAGRGGAAGTALNQAGNIGTVSWFDTNGPLIAANAVAGTVPTAAATADGGNGGCGGGKGSSAVETARLTLSSADTGVAMGARGAAGGSGTTAPVGGSEADWGGGGGESGGDTDAAITSANNGTSMRGGGGGSGGRTNTNISQPGRGGGAAATFAAQGDTGAQSTRLPHGGAGGVGGGSSVVTGGTGGFPGGGGGGGAGVAGGFGGAGGHGCVVVTTFF